ncbi:MAG: DUF1501 domain-containing protein [Planctomycetes bacterium]|nr:DUF1501 domain-containing protein [Planctomycetota bacterium]
MNYLKKHACDRAHSRRDFLRGALALGPAIYFAPNVLLRGAFGSPSTAPRNIILVELIGGNDGLNTIVPHGVNGGIYYSEFRKVLNIPKNKLINIDGEIGFNSALGSLVDGLSLQNGLWSHGKLAIVQGVSYPNPSFSHEVAANIWAKGDPTAAAPDGWLARVLSQTAGGTFTAADISDRTSAVFSNASQLVPAVESLSSFVFPYDFFHSGDAQNRRDTYQTIVNNLSGAGPGKQKSVADTSASVLQLIDAFAGIAPIAPVEAYPQDSISDALQLAVTLLKSSLGFRFIHLGVSGFDTHANENAGQYHDNLIKTVADALAATYSDLVAQGLDANTIIVVYSEFGRTVYENGSLGTDHGSVNPVFVMGTPVQGGVITPHPAMDPNNLTADGELPMVADFRDVFGTIVSKWLQLDPATIFPGYTVAPFGFLP